MGDERYQLSGSKPETCSKMNKVTLYSHEISVELIKDFKWAHLQDWWHILHLTL